MRINELQDASTAWCAVLAGMQLDLFTPLDSAPLRASELAAVLDVDAGKLGLLLYALVVVGLLIVEDGRFANTPESAQFLVRGKASYMGGRHGLWTEFAEAALKTAASVRTGCAQAKHNYAAMSEAELLITLGGLHDGAVDTGRELAERFDFGAYRTVLDVGGGSGGVSIGLMQTCPAVQVTIAELPSVVPIAQRYVAEAGLLEGIAIVASDVLHDRVPGPFDAAVVCNLLQVLSADEAQTALHHVGQSLRPGGTVYILAILLDDSRISPAADALFNVVFLNFYDAGQSYTESEYRAWLGAAGFVDITRQTLSDGHGLLVARKSE
jgi:hypothetical protein